MKDAEEWASRENLARAIETSTSITEALSKLGKSREGHAYSLFRLHAKMYDLDTSHFRFLRRTFRPDALADAVGCSSSIAQVIRRLGCNVSGGMYTLVRSEIARFRLDCSHFTGQGWHSSTTQEHKNAVKRASMKTRRSDDQVFCRDSTFQSRRGLKIRLLERGVPNQCARCGLTEWLGEPITLDIDHINGVSNDNRMENLRFLCPNCHHQTPTHAGRNRRGLFSGGPHNETI